MGVRDKYNDRNKSKRKIFEGDIHFDDCKFCRQGDWLFELDFRFKDIGRRRHRALSNGVPDLLFRNDDFSSGRAGRNLNHHGGARRPKRYFRRATSLPNLNAANAHDGNIFLGADVSFSGLANRLAIHTRPARAFVDSCSVADDFFRDVLGGVARIFARLAAHDTDRSQPDCRANFPRHRHDNACGFVLANGA